MQICNTAANLHKNIRTCKLSIGYEGVFFLGYSGNYIFDFRESAISCSIVAIRLCVLRRLLVFVEFVLLVFSELALLVFVEFVLLVYFAKIVIISKLQCLF